MLKTLHMLKTFWDLLDPGLTFSCKADVQVTKAPQILYRTYCMSYKYQQI